MTGSFAMIAAKLLKRVKKYGNARSAKTSCCATTATSSLFTSIHWKRGLCPRDLELLSKARQESNSSNPVQFAAEESLQFKKVISIETETT